MKNYTIGIIAFISIAAITAVSLRYLHPTNDSAPGNGLSETHLIRTSKIQRKNFMQTQFWFGQAVSPKKVHIIAQTDGQLISISVDDHQPVSRGTTLFTLGGPVVEKNLLKLKSNLTAAQKQLEVARQIEITRQKELKTKLVLREDLLAAQLDVNRLSAAYVQAGSSLRTYQKLLVIRSAVDGVFTNRKISVGQIVQKGDNLAEIISIKHLYVAATLFPKKDDDLKGKEAFINIPDGSSISGTIVNVLPERTPEGAVTVWIEGADLDRFLRPGQTVSGKIKLSLHQGVLAVPQSAIVRDDNEQAYVFVKDSSGYHSKPVSTGIISGGCVEIMSGLKDGDEIVARGAYELFYRNFNKTYKVAD